MIIIPVKYGNIERALKDYKWKFKRTKVKEQLNDRKQHKKKSVKRREEINKAKYKQKKNNE
jgi:small subunit ribosomal protein S21